MTADSSSASPVKAEDFTVKGQVVVAVITFACGPERPGEAVGVSSIDNKLALLSSTAR